jgi:hypothetical protein
MRGAGIKAKLNKPKPIGGGGEGLSSVMEYFRYF